MEDVIAAGGLEFFVENRVGERDGGPSIQVRTTVDGQRVQLLRFDMFRIQPHYHYAPMGKNLRYDLDPLTVDDGIGWAMALLGSKLPQLVEKAGHPELATPANLDAAVKVLPEVEQRWRALS